MANVPRQKSLEASVNSRPQAGELEKKFICWRRTTKRNCGNGYSQNQLESLGLAAGMVHHPVQICGVIGTQLQRELDDIGLLGLDGAIILPAVQLRVPISESKRRRTIMFRRGQINP